VVNLLNWSLNLYPNERLAGRQKLLEFNYRLSFNSSLFFGEKYNLATLFYGLVNNKRLVSLADSTIAATTHKADHAN
jgi:hypothetical protein